MRLLLAGLLVFCVASCAAPQTRREDNPNWRPTSMPVEQVRDTREPQWKDVPAGEDLIDPKDVKPEQPKAEEKPEPKPEAKADEEPAAKAGEAPEAKADEEPQADAEAEEKPEATAKEEAKGEEGDGKGEGEPEKK